MGEAQDLKQDTKQRIEKYLKAKFPERKELMIEGLEILEGGTSHPIFMFTAHWQEAQGSVSEPLVLRREPDIGLVPPYDLRPEYEVLKRLHGSGIPVPKVYFLEEESKVLERPFVLMEKIEAGERFFEAWLKQPEHRAHLLKDYVSIMSKIHKLDWQALDLSFLGVPDNDRHFAENGITRWEKVMEENQFSPYPIMVEILTWLKRNVPPAERTTLCHGDYTVFNAHARNGRIVAMFDWEMAGIGDPVSDVSWACLFGDIFRIPDWDEAGFIRNYEAMIGEKLNEESCFFWKVFSYFKLASICIAAVRAGVESSNINMELLANFLPTLFKLQDKAAKMLGF